MRLGLALAAAPCHAQVGGKFAPTGDLLPTIENHSKNFK
jgi:hypothetical protein